MDYLEATAFTYMHSSPPALPVIAAALETLQIHRILGDALRGRLLELVWYFQHRLGELFPGQLSQHEFPMQTIYFSNPEQAEEMGRWLWMNGIWAVIQFNPDDCLGGGVLRFILTVRHQKEDIDRVLKIGRINPGYSMLSRSN